MRLLQCLAGVGFGIADILSDQFLTIHGDHLAGFQDADGRVDLAQEAGDGCLTRTRVAGENHVKRRHGGF